MAKATTVRAKETEKCFACKGKGKQHVTSTFEGKTEKHDITCVWCDGKGVMPKGRGAAIQKAEKEFWCSCPPAASNEEEMARIGVFHDDGECPKCDKHHWHCAKCDKIRQVG